MYMTCGASSSRARQIAASLERIISFQSGSTWARRHNEPGIADFTFASPHEMPLRGVVDALQDWSMPLTRDWFARKTFDDDAQHQIATGLQAAHGLPFVAGDVALTDGAAASISVALKTVADVGDEVIYCLPGWLYYEPLIRDAGLAPVTIQCHRETWDIDLNALEAAIGPRTRAVIVNSPHNPTGRVYPAETLRRIDELLEAANRRYGTQIVVISDEPYNRILFDGVQATSPVEYIRNTMIVYSFSKILQTPGLRVGYLALSPALEGREELRRTIHAMQIAGGWAFPSASLRHALIDFNQLAISVPRLQRKRDRLVHALRQIGYDTNVPEAALFILVRSPWADDGAFVDLLAQHDVLVMPGNLFGLPGYFRICLTASEEAIERGLRGFAAAWRAAQFTSMPPESPVPRS